MFLIYPNIKICNINAEHLMAFLGKVESACRSIGDLSGVQQAWWLANWPPNTIQQSFENTI